MNSRNINAISTSVIAFVTVIVAMFGFYINLKSTITLKWIIVFEFYFLIAMLLFVLWVKDKVVLR